jgi:WD40 repeat protein
MLTVEQEGSPLIKINGGSDIRAVAFAGNGEYLVSGGDEAGVWRVEDGKQMATMAAEYAWCLAVSKDGKWIAAGTSWGEVWVWDAKTYKKVFSHKEDYNGINGVDFSPDSTRLVSASQDTKASIWDIATGKRVRTLDHGNLVIAAKYSPQGDRIATATGDSVRVYDSNEGRLLTDIEVTVTPWRNTGLLWFNHHLFVVSNGKIKQIEASTGLAVSEWPVPDSVGSSCIALPKHGKFITYSTRRTVTFWDTATHIQLGFIQHSEDIHSIAVSPDDRLLAIGGKDGNFTINSLSHRVVVSILSLWIVVHMNNFLASIIFPQNSIPLSSLHPTFQEPDVQIDVAALHSWKHNQLANAESLLTAAIPESRNTSHHILASRALVRARLKQWDAAIADATEVIVTLLSRVLLLIYTKSIKSQPSVIGYIAKCVAHVGNGDKHKAYRACDIAFERFHSTHVTFLLLIKVCVPCTRAWLPSAAHIA